MNYKPFDSARTLDSSDCTRFWYEGVKHHLWDESGHYGDVITIVVQRNDSFYYEEEASSIINADWGHLVFERDVKSLEEDDGVCDSPVKYPEEDP